MVRTEKGTVTKPKNIIRTYSPGSRGKAKEKKRNTKEREQEDDDEQNESENESDDEYESEQSIEDISPINRKRRKVSNRIEKNRNRKEKEQDNENEQDNGKTLYLLIANKFSFISIIFLLFNSTSRKCRNHSPSIRNDESVTNL